MRFLPLPGASSGVPWRRLHATGRVPGSSGAGGTSFGRHAAPARTSQCSPPSLSHAAEFARSWGVFCPGPFGTRHQRAVCQAQTQKEEILCRRQRPSQPQSRSPLAVPSTERVSLPWAAHRRPWPWVACLPWSEAPRELSITRQSTFSARRVCQPGDGSLLSALFTLYRQSCDPGLLSKAYPSCTSLLSHSSPS